MATLLTVLACTVCITVGVLFWGAQPLLYIMLLPAGVAVFVISLIIGHFLAQPLRDVHRKIMAVRQGNTCIDFSPTEDLYEADVLALDFKELCETARAQRNDLSTKKERQTAFISDVAHELRTPLTAIRGNAEILLDPDLPEELHTKFCTIIINESERLSRLSNDLLTLQHIEEDTTPMELKRINLKNLAQEVIDMLGPILNQREAHTRVVGEAPDVLGNPDRLKQVMANLTENASRFIDVGGHIIIELYGLDDKSIITVKDDGCGFGAIDPNLLFDRFYRTDTSRYRGTGGTGLGLAIVKSAVEAHDGTVVAFNRPEGGACFLIALPSIPPEL
ncbi:MAG: HAMP domain-containing sensor histidine kinase [Raoultibacter sp.]